MKKIIFILCSWVWCGWASAESTLLCSANFDGSSHYELREKSLNFHAGDKAQFRYITEDGLDLQSELSIKAEQFEARKFYSLSADDGNMSVNVDAKYEENKAQYRGTFRVSFDLDHAEPVELEGICRIL